MNHKKRLGKTFGKSIKKIVEIDESTFSTALERPYVSVFMHRDRRKIFEYLSRSPCSHLRQIARDIGMSPPSAKWHLSKLEERGFIYSRMVENHLIFYPRKLISEKSIKFFYYLSRKKTGDILKLILLKPGITQREISEELNRNPQSVSKLLANIKKEGLVYYVKDGRTKKHFISKRTIEKVGRTSRWRKKEFISWLLQELAKDGVKPEIMENKDWRITIKIFDGKKDVPLTVITKPLNYILKEER